MMTRELRNFEKKLAAERREESLTLLEKFGIKYRRPENPGIVYIGSKKGDFTLALSSQNWNRGELRGDGILALAACLRLENDCEDLRKI